MVRALCLLLLAVVAAGCNSADPAAEASEEPGATASCGPVETVPIQGEGHLVGDQEPPVPYNSTPPTSGWHTATDVAAIVAPDADPLSEPEQVTVLELGGVVISHNGMGREDRQRLESLIAEHYSGAVALTQYDKLDRGQVALTAWGKLQHCDALDVAAVEAFVAAYAQQ